MYFGLRSCNSVLFLNIEYKISKLNWYLFLINSARNDSPDGKVVNPTTGNPSLELDHQALWKPRPFMDSLLSQIPEYNTKLYILFPRWLSTIVIWEYLSSCFLQSFLFNLRIIDQSNLKSTQIISNYISWLASLLVSKKNVKVKCFFVSFTSFTTVLTFIFFDHCSSNSFLALSKKSWTEIKREKNNENQLTLWGFFHFSSNSSLAVSRNSLTIIDCSIKKE